MPSSRDLSSPTDVHSPDDASDEGTVIFGNICCFIYFFSVIFCLLTVGISYASPHCHFVSSAMFGS